MLYFATMFSRVLAISILCLCAGAQSLDADKIYQVGDPSVSKVVVVHQRDPGYTKQARDKKIQGIVGIDLIVEKNGKAENVKVVKSVDPGLDANAVNAVKSWKFEPCRKDGHPVRCAVHIEVSYSLQ